MEKNLKTDNILLTRTSNRGRNKYWMIGLDMLICCNGRLNVMIKFSDMEILVIDDGFLNRRRWFQCDINTVLDDPNDVFNDTFFFFRLLKMIVSPLKNFQLGFDTLMIIIYYGFVSVCIEFANCFIM